MRQPAISNRQKEVLPLLFIGKSNGEIAQILGISALTVKNHVQCILRKLRAVNRIAACYIALEKGILKPPEPPAPPEQTTPVEQPRKVNQLPEPKPLPPLNWISYRGIRACWESTQVEVDGQMIDDLTLQQFRLLYFLINNQHRNAHSREAVLNALHPDGKAVDDRTVDVLIRRLRNILAPYGYGDCIEAVHGHGYRLRALSGEGGGRDAR